MTLPLTLIRPLVSIDTETTGTDPLSARVVEFGWATIFPDGTRAQAGRLRIHPGCPIPPEATAIHGISDADVADAPPFVVAAAEITTILTGCDLLGFNLRAYDIPLLCAEFERAGFAWPFEGARIVDAFVLYRERERHTLSNAVRLFCGREHVGAHGATADAVAALDVLLGQLQRYPTLPHTVAELDAESGGQRPDWATPDGKIRWDDAGRAVLGFGKHAGRALSDPDPDVRGFCRWVLGKDFAPEVKALIRRALGGERITREVARG